MKNKLKGNSTKIHTNTHTHLFKSTSLTHNVEIIAFALGSKSFLAKKRLRREAFPSILFNKVPSAMATTKYTQI